MKRRDFIGHAGCGPATVLAASGIPAAAQTQGADERREGVRRPAARAILPDPTANLVVKIIRTRVDRPVS